MPKMLRHVKTGEVWPMNPNLARHPDVEVFDQPDPQFAAAVAANKDVTLGELAGAVSEPPVVTDQFEDVPDYVPPPEQAVKAPAKKKAKAKAKAKAPAKVEAKEPEQELEDPAAEDDDFDIDMDLDDFEG